MGTCGCVWDVVSEVRHIIDSSFVQGYCLLS